MKGKIMIDIIFETNMKMFEFVLINLHFIHGVTIILGVIVAFIAAGLFMLFASTTWDRNPPPKERVYKSMLTCMFVAGIALLIPAAIGFFI